MFPRYPPSIRITYQELRITAYYTGHTAGKRLFGSKKSREIRDPVCGMIIDVEDLHYSTAANGGQYFFCSPGCKSSFKRDLNREYQSESAQRKVVRKSARKASHCDSCASTKNPH